jgi:hypothetical protein
MKEEQPFRKFEEMNAKDTCGAGCLPWFRAVAWGRGIFEKGIPVPDLAGEEHG